MGTLGFAPLTAPAFIESVKAVPMAERGTRKQALRDSFAAELPREILEAPGRGLSSLNRELLVGAWKDGIDWFTSVNLEESGEWFTIGSIEANVARPCKPYRFPNKPIVQSNCIPGMDGNVETRFTGPEPAVRCSPVKVTVTM